MVVLKGMSISTYRKSFQSKFPELTQVYETNLEFRVGRRIKENYHSLEPFSWEYESESDSEFGNKIHKLSNLPLHKYKHEKFNKAYQMKAKKQTAIKQTDGGNMQVLSVRQQEGTFTKQVPNLQSVAVQTERQFRSPDKLDSTKEDKGTIPEKEIRKPNRDKLQKSSTALHEKRSQRRTKSKAVHGARHPESRPASAPLPETQAHVHNKDEPISDPKPPFILYGYKDKETVTGAKKTHNVRASTEIYPSALRALKRRQMEKKEEQKQLSSTTHKPVLYGEFNEKMKRETSQWDTEYSSHYITHDKSQYERSVPRCRTPYRNVECLAATM